MKIGKKKENGNIAKRKNPPLLKERGILE